MKILQLKYNFSVKNCNNTDHGIQFITAPEVLFNWKTSLYDLKEYKQGLFEVQDEGSQMVSAMIKISEKKNILDYCAGSGGKSLAIAASLNVN